MKMDAETYAALEARLSPLDTTEIRDAYRRGDFPRAQGVRDLDKRYRWDLYYYANGYRVTPNALNDAHIYTALRRIVPSLLTA